MGHAYIAVGDKFCRILAVMTAPEGVQPLEPHLTMKVGALAASARPQNSPPSQSPAPARHNRKRSKS